ncbi:hypothetical protein MVEN_01339400 [Mycena venus]|uniref:Uncharacterized protein n=1 Tax=Mycena venus TaxID=2733690 RepID=A0A8H6Y1Z2_9AGAR|nr:hypothetical protein MVEN_01339400 [Mycena venus]
MAISTGTYYITSVKWSNYVTLNGTSEPGVSVTGENPQEGVVPTANQKWYVIVTGSQCTISLASNHKAFAFPSEEVEGAKIIIRSVKQDYDIIADGGNKYRLKVPGKDLYWDLPHDDDHTQIQITTNNKATDHEWVFTEVAQRR